MLRGRRLALAKGLLQAWAARCYRRRETLMVIGFAGEQARLLHAPGKAAAFNERWIAPIAGGGATPAASAIALADRVLAQRRRSADERVELWLLSDARFATLPPRPQRADHCTVIDFDDGPRALGRAARLAAAWGADCLPVRAVVASR
ncbi:vWA domain-containing protein [Pseudothauera nasutitermitis]|nr:magnesium chelatase [Pseudothauera nasutitermitis]